MLAWLTLPLAATFGATAVAGEPAPASIQYNRDIRPLLSDKCFRCHGPDAAQRKAKLRLDRRPEAIAERDGTRPVTPGAPEESEAYLRINSDDALDRMPPPESGLVLSTSEVALLRRWIEQGAEYQPHWAFIPPQSLPLPQVRRRDWPRNPIDTFVLADLERMGLEPSPEARREVLLRRVTLTLTGLPPSRAELDDFLADLAPDAYERAVDRLLQSPRHGERLALDWLDGARFADTNGFYTDAERHAWPWRDWVINAFNANMPFDRFTIEQLAGDLLPRPSLDQRIATGFNRNHMVTNESCIIDEEYRVGYVVDRVDTTSTVWLGLTIGCARCHDHKYDPISQRDYYALFACFNNIAESGLVKEEPGVNNPPPFVQLPTIEQQRRLGELSGSRQKTEADYKAVQPELNRAMALWEPTALASLAEITTAGRLAHLDFDRDGFDRRSCGLDVAVSGKLVSGPGVKGRAIAFDATQYLELDGLPVLERTTPFTLTVWIMPGSSPQGCVVSRMNSTPDARGFEIIWYKSQPRIDLVGERGRSAIEIVARAKFAARQWHHLTVTYDGTGKAAGVRLYIDGAPAATVVRRDDLAGSIASDEPWRVAWKGTGVGFEGSIDELRYYDRPLDAREVEDMYWRDLLTGIFQTPAAERSRSQVERLQSYYLARYGTDEVRRLSRELAALRSEEETLRRSISSAPVMQEREQARETRVLMRGQYDQPGLPVEAGIPAALGGWPTDAPRDRLGLARWFVSGENPLTARVAVNRYWQLAFGEGLVRTINDFGLQGEMPTHPELLDWLAVRFAHGSETAPSAAAWDIKALLRLIVTSATYRQSSNFTPNSLALDPENRRLARGPRHRLSAESIRDQALALGGLLVDRIGGPSVKPYQPPGLWEAVSYNGEQTYVPDHGASLYRRGLYTYWKRQSPPPEILTFDGPTRETCSVRRARTNTPLQALLLLNDVTYVEAARGLATRMMRDNGPAAGDRIRFGFRSATGRLPEDGETAALERLFRRQLGVYRASPGSAVALLRAGESTAPPALDPCELAAWTLTASVLLNLDEVITQH
jgi:hypothetical protein